MSDTSLYNSTTIPAPGGEVGMMVLKDVTNLLPQKRRLSSPNDKYRVIASSYSANEQINQLLKEKAILMKQVADRNKIVELSGIELQKLRVNLMEVQQQNWQLARTNSQLLAELNADRDKLRVLRHELVCAQRVLAIKDLELQEKKAKMHPQTPGQMPNTKSYKAGELSHTNDNKNKPLSTKGKRFSKVTFVAKGLQSAEKSEKRRRSLGRQSSTFKTGEVDFAGDAIKAGEGVPTKEKLKCRRVSVRRQSSTFETKGLDSCEDAIKITEGVPTKEKTKCRRLSLGKQSTTVGTEEMTHTEDVAKMAEGVPTKEKPESRRVSLRRRSSVFGTEEIRSMERVLKIDVADQSQTKEKLSGRRRSSRFITEDSTVNILEVDDVPVCSQLNDTDRVDDSAPLADPITETALVEANKDEPAAEESAEDAFDVDQTKLPFHPRIGEGYADGSAARYIRRSSLARPMRRAAEKVQSYREAPLRSKMRRIE